MMDAELIRDILLIAIPVLLGLTLHECAHASTALAFGDPTGKLMGRVSLNPLRHLDPLGTLCMLLSSLAGAGIGWAKPVPVNQANLHPPRLGDLMVSFAGPMANIGLAAVAGLGLRALHYFSDDIQSPQTYQLLTVFLFYMMRINLCLALFNLIPLFPLDGHHIQREFLPAHWQAPYMHWQMRYGQIVLLALLFGPRLLQIATENKVNFNPIRTVYGLIGYPIERFLAGSALFHVM